jgi:murein DD-endopeptidase MepM/ murein hydrolase activator NlpD
MVKKKFPVNSVHYKTFINKDFRKGPQPQRHPALRWVLFGMGCAVLGIVLANTPIGSSQPEALVNDNDLQTIGQQATATDASVVEPTDTAFETPAEPEIPTVQYELKAKNGDSLSTLFDRAKISHDQLVELIQSSDEARELTRIHPGDTMQVTTDTQGKLLSLTYELDKFTFIQAKRTDSGLDVSRQQYAIETRNTHASATIESSLFLAAQNAGLSDVLTMELAGIFGWDVDFALDIRAGDRFTVIYEEILKDGKKIADGNILAAEFVNQGETYRALRYADPVTGEAGYYSPDGRSLRKAFLRTPVNFSRISSKFTTSRYHPILHRFRSHKGVDYAAPTGTPVKASGDGKIVFRGRKGGYGNVVIVQHGARYTTLYGHLSRFNSNANLGSKVKQGQVIGYVGATGLASGPHLHYEFQIDGVHRNPLTVKLPSTQPIAERYIDNFMVTTQSFLAQLDTFSRDAIALNAH